MKKRPASTAIKQPFKRPRPAIQRTVSSRNLAFQANTVRKGPEKKNIDIDDTLTTGTEINLPNSASTWVIGATQLLNAAAQGTTATTRVGRKIQGKKLHISYSCTLQATSVGGGQVKIRVVYDKQSNGAQFAITDYLTLNGFDSPNNLDNSDRFITLANHVTEPISVQNNYSVCGKISIPLSLETMFTGAGGAIANVLTGSIYLICAQTGEISVSGPQLGFYSRYRFEDM